MSWSVDPIRPNKRRRRSEFLPIRAAIVIAVGLLYHYIAVAKSATYNACGIQAQNYKLRIIGDTMTKEEIQLIVREELSGILEEARGRAASIKGDQDKIGEQVIDILIRTIGERAERQTSPSQSE